MTGVNNYDPSFTQLDSTVDWKVCCSQVGNKSTTIIQSLVLSTACLVCRTWQTDRRIVEMH